MKRFWLASKIALLVVLVIVLVPYGWSRLGSSSRRISVHQIESPGPYSGHSKGGIRLACYNIAHGRGLVFDNWNGESRQVRLQRLDAIAQKLAESRADLIALNEVDFDCSWTHRINQVEYLAKAAGYPYWAQERNLDFRLATCSWEFGNAIISKFPIEKAEVVDFPAYRKWEDFLVGKKRGLVVRVRTNGSEVIDFASVHLSHRSEALRVESMRRLVELAEAASVPFFYRRRHEFDSTGISRR